MAKNRGISMKLKIFALVVMLGIVGRVDAVFFSADEMLMNCESESLDRRNTCLGYLAGVVNAQEDTVKWVDGEEDFPKLFCIPESVRPNQLRKIFIKYANERPEVLHTAADSMVSSAIEGTFPCE